MVECSKKTTGSTCLHVMALACSLSDPRSGTYLGGLNLAEERVFDQHNG